METDGGLAWRTRIKVIDATSFEKQMAAQRCHARQGNRRRCSVGKLRRIDVTTVKDCDKQTWRFLFDVAPFVAYFSGYLVFVVRQRWKGSGLALPALGVMLLGLTNLSTADYRGDSGRSIPQR